MMSEVSGLTSRLTLDMEVLVISHEDSRLPIVDLARTLGDMTKQHKLFPEDISIDLIDENLTGCPPRLGVD